MRRSRSLLLLPLLAGLVAAPAAALDLGGHDRDGVVVGLGLGVGWNRYEFRLPGGEPVETGWEDVFSPTLSVGWARSDHLIGSLSFSGWRKNFVQDITPISTRSLLFMADLAWFPRGEGFWLKGVVGVGDLELEAVLPTERRVSKRTDLVLGAGAGYELRVSDTAAAGLAYDVRRLDVGDLAPFGDTSNVHQSVQLFLRYYR